MSADPRERFSVIGGDDGDLPEYPLGPDDRLDSHYFMTWERRRWLNSDMRLRGTAECRAYYFDLINIAYDQAPIGTLPDDYDMLAKLVHVEPGHFRALVALPFGPLHNWRRCLCRTDDGEPEVRLMHSFVLRSLTDAIARKEHNRAQNEAANAKKRRQRLRSQIAGYHAELAKNDAAVQWMDDWLLKEGCEYRSSSWVERAMTAWHGHIFDLNGGRRPAPTGG